VCGSQLAGDGTRMGSARLKGLIAGKGSYRFCGALQRLYDT